MTVVDIPEHALQLNIDNARKLNLATHIQTHASDFVDFCDNTEQKFDQIIFIKVFHHLMKWAFIILFLLLFLTDFLKLGLVLSFSIGAIFALINFSKNRQHN